MATTNLHPNIQGPGVLFPYTNTPPKDGYNAVTVEHLHCSSGRLNPSPSSLGPPEMCPFSGPPPSPLHKPLSRDSSPQRSRCLLLPNRTRLPLPHGAYGHTQLGNKRQSGTSRGQVKTGKAESPKRCRVSWRGCCLVLDMSPGMAEQQTPPASRH